MLRLFISTSFSESFSVQLLKPPTTYNSLFITVKVSDEKRPDDFDILRTKFIFILCLIPCENSSLIWALSPSPRKESSSELIISSWWIIQCYNSTGSTTRYFLPKIELTQLPPASRTTAPDLIISFSSQKIAFELKNCNYRLWIHNRCQLE